MDPTQPDDPNIPLKTPHPRQGKRGLTLRALMLLVVIVGGVLGTQVRLAHRQRDVATFLRQNRWSIDYDWQWEGDRPVTNRKPWAPQWLVEQLGVDFFGHVYSIGHTQATDTMLAEVGKLDQLEQLNIFGNEVTDAGLGHIRNLTNLHALYLSNTSITGAGLANLERMTKLRYLGLQGSRIDDASLVHIKDLQRLEFLSLNSVTVGDGAMMHLAGLTSLTELALDNTNVSDAGLLQLKGLKNLKTLWLGGTRATPAGVIALKKFLPNVEIKGID